MQPTLQRAWQLYRFRRYALALEETVKFLGQYPESAEAFCLAALIHGKEKRQKQALEAAEAAIRYMPDWSYPHYVHGLISYWFNRYDWALRSLSEALRIQPNDPDFYEIIAAIHSEQGHQKTALKMAEKGLEQNAEHVGCLYRRGAALFDLKRTKEAEEVFRHTLSIHTEHAPTQGFVGYFAVQQGNFVEALPLLRCALRDNPEWELVRTAWKEALCGQYRYYGSVARIRQWIFQKYQWHTTVVVFFATSLTMYFLVEQDQRGWTQMLPIILILGTLSTCAILLSIYLLFAGYLGVFNRTLLIIDSDLRRTFNWKESLRRHWKGYLVILYFVIAIIVNLIRRNW